MSTTPDYDQEQATEPLLVKPKVAWKMLACGNTRGYELLTAGELDSFLDGRSRKITVKSIHRYIQQHLRERQHQIQDSKSNTIKHGAFSGINFLPGEDPLHYAKLKDGLVAEYKPCGRSQEKLVESVTKALWKLKRVQRSILNHELVSDTRE